jgi:hypothetical protein
MSDHTHQRRLFDCNCRGALYRDEILVAESDWIASDMAAIGESDNPVDFARFREGLNNALTDDGRRSAAACHIAQKASRDELAAIVAQYAVDGLTEAQAMFYVIPRLPPDVQMPVIRVLIDEFGCGNGRAAHSQLYRDLLEELGLPGALESYVDGTRPELFAFVNVYHWLTRRAPAVDYYLGALAYTEAAIPASFQVFAEACGRLGIKNSDYFTEHVHIDEFHARDALQAIRRMDSTCGIDYAKAWMGVELVRRIGHAAFQAAVAVALGEESTWTI